MVEPNSIFQERTKQYAVFDGKLENVEIGKVVTRFPPEPSGYLHIGHIKAVVLNRHLADIYKGKMLVRFDDTNPEKESLEFVDNILNDLKLANVKWDGEHNFVTDYFEYFEEIMTKLMSEGRCYCDNTPTEKMRENRDKGVASPCRDQSVEENMKIWEQMKDKSIASDSLIKQYCVRGKFPNVKELIAVHAGRIQRAGMNLYKNTGTGDQMKTITLYFATAIAEIVGCYLPWLWLKQNGSPWLLIPAGVSLAAFAWLLTLHEAATGRVYAAYGGVYIFAAILWLWAVDGIRPSNWDVAGVAVALLGMSIIAFQPR